jgi:hypothetical protein
MMNNRLFPPRIHAPTYLCLCSLTYLCSGLAICATYLPKSIAQIAKPEHRWASRWASKWEK